MDSICKIDQDESCNQCDSALKKMWKCNSCMKDLCEKCNDIHKANNHQVRQIRSSSNTPNSTLTLASESFNSSLQFDFQTSGNFNLDLNTHICRVLDYSIFCYTCSTAICDKCSQNIHLNHSKIPLDDAKRMAKENSSQLLQKLQNYNQIFKREYDIQIMYMKETLKLEKNLVLDNIEKVFQEINETLVKCKQELYEKLNNAIDKKCDDLKLNVYNILVAVYESHYMMQDLNEKMSNCYEELDFMNITCMIQKRVQEYEILLQKVHSGREINLGFKYLHHMFIDNFISKIGEFYKKPNDPGPIGSIPISRIQSLVKSQQQSPPPVAVTSSSSSMPLYSSIASSLQTNVLKNNRRRITFYNDVQNNWFRNAEQLSIKINDPFFSYMSNIGRPIFNVAHEITAEIPLLQPNVFGAAGSGNGEFCRPWGICCDEINNIYIADRSNNRIQIFSSDGKFIRKFGELGQLPGEFDKPAGITLDTEKNIIVADKDNHRIQVFNEFGEFLYQFGQKGTRNGQFNYPWDVAVNSRNEIAVSDSRNYRVQLFSHEGTFLKKFSFQLSSTSSRRNDYVFPRGLCFNPSGFLMVTDFNKHSVVVVDPSFSKSYIFAEEGKNLGYLSRPQGIICDDKGRIVISDSKNNRIQLIDSNGDFLAEIGGNGAPLGQLERPCGVALLSTGRIITVDFGNDRIIIY